MKFDVDETDKIKAGIYLITDTVSGKYYIGSTKNFYQRFNQHSNDLVNNRHCNHYLQRTYNLRRESFVFSIVEIADENTLVEKEQLYLDRMFGKTKCFNLCKIANSTTGIIHTVETKSKMAASHVGKKHSEATKLKMSVAKKGRRFSEEHRKALSKSHKNLDGAIKRRQKSLWRVWNNEISLEVTSLQEFCDDNNLSRSCLSMVASGIRTSHKGWKCAKLIHP